MSKVDWCDFLREECESWLTNHSQEIGGMDDQGHPIVVEIDRSKYFHRKYHSGGKVTGCLEALKEERVNVS